MTLWERVCSIMCRPAAPTQEERQSQAKAVQEASHRLANQAAKVQAVARVLTKEADVLTDLVKDMRR